MNIEAISAITEAFEKARANGIRCPKVSLYHESHTFIVSRAPDTGRNPGAIYVKENTVYLGKIADGRFFPAYECTMELEDAVLAACANPLAAAVAYGQRFGKCSCCGRELTNKESIDLGIGPICRANFF